MYLIVILIIIISDYFYIVTCEALWAALYV